MSPSPTPTSSDATEKSSNQLLHLVFGGELKSLDKTTFNDLKKLDIVGIFPNYAEAYKAWKSAAQRTVDSAQTRYFIVHIHKLLDPDATPPKP
jgi:hypothetical protein